jgi:hypothetical protein
VRNEVLQSFIIPQKRKANIFRMNCLLNHFIEGKMEARIEVTGRRGRRLKQVLDDLKEKI